MPIFECFRGKFSSNVEIGRIFWGTKTCRFYKNEIYPPFGKSRQKTSTLLNIFGHLVRKLHFGNLYIYPYGYCETPRRKMRANFEPLLGGSDLVEK